MLQKITQQIEQPVAKMHSTEQEEISRRRENMLITIRKANRRQILDEKRS
jgi:hypothetical protein